MQFVISGLYKGWYTFISELFMKDKVEPTIFWPCLYSTLRRNVFGFGFGSATFFIVFDLNKLNF